MKNLTKTFAIVLLLFIVGCNNSQKTPKETKGETIEVVAPEAMYEVLKDNPNAQLIDVRTAEEHSVSHLKNSQNICVTDDDFKEKAMSLNKNEPVYVYCKKGGRSARAAKVLKDLGFTKIYDLQGGITAWDEQKLDTEQ